MEADDEDDTIHFNGSTCVDFMFDYLDEKTVDENGDDRRVICVFQNFKGYDGMFVLQYLYRTHREIEGQIKVGTKALSLQTGGIKFIDCCCFPPFPSASFPDTFWHRRDEKRFFPSQIQYDGKPIVRWPYATCSHVRP